MTVKHTGLALLLGLSLGGALVTTGSTVSASANKGYRTYSSFPKVMRGTWREKSKTDYYKGKNNANWSYKFNKNSYSLIIRVKGKKARSSTFPKKTSTKLAMPTSLNGTMSSLR